MVVAEMLRRSGYEVTTAASGDEALALIAGGAELDILVTDVAMDGMDGKTLSVRARQHSPPSQSSSSPAIRPRC